MIRPRQKEMVRARQKKRERESETEKERDRERCLKEGRHTSEMRRGVTTLGNETKRGEIKEMGSG